MKVVNYISESDGVHAVAKAHPLPVMIRDYDYKYLATAATTQLVTGSGFLHSVTVTETAAGSIKFIDGTSGSTTNLAELKSSISEGTYTFDVEFSTGLRIIAAANSKFTVSYKAD